MGASAWAWLKSVPDRFPFGLAPFIILVVTLCAGAYVFTHPPERTHATLTLWTFANFHQRAYEKAIHPPKPEAEAALKAQGLTREKTFEELHPGVTVDAQLVHGTAITNRLRAAFQANLDVPDLVEAEISSCGSFFRGEEQFIGFQDLTPLLQEAGFLDEKRFVTQRLAPYKHRGKIYGMPHDVHPVMLAYRRDLFEQCGLKAEELDTWEKFIAAGKKVRIPNQRYIMLCPEADLSVLQTVLYQRGGMYFDAEGQLIMDNALALDTLRWYVRLTAGPERIAGSPDNWGQGFYEALKRGYIMAFIAPDWRTRNIEEEGKDIQPLPGNMALMPLPAFEPGGRRTSTWGGTMLGMTRRCSDPELAWKLMRHLYNDREALAGLFRNTNIIPPLKDAWTHPVYDEPRPFWSGQKLGREYINLAPDVPRTYPSPFIPVAVSKMSEVLSACVSYYNQSGETGFEEFSATKLKTAAEYVREQMKRNPF